MSDENRVHSIEVAELPDGYFVTLSEREAHLLIQSLAGQLASRSANFGRQESRTDKGEYFSVGVYFPPLEVPKPPSVDSWPPKETRF
ncbi:MAG: hypothetical protein KAS32_28835 [Candidatus Peribacteraceae bacterium]|nr:hypothetical protein [Candidatus Peribacteraceae bacterium]